MTKRINKVQRIKEIMIERITSIIDEIAFEPKLEKEMFDLCFDEAVNIAVCYCLKAMIFHGKNTEETIYTYSMYSFTLDRKKEKQEYVDDAEKVCLERAMAYCKENRSVCKWQIKNFFGVVHRNRKKKYGQEYNFFDLAFATAHSKGFMEWYDQLFYRKSPLKVANEKDSLNRAYESYNQFIQYIKELDNKGKKKEYVIFSLFLNEVESLYAFGFVAWLVNYYIKNGLDIPKELSQHVLQFIQGRSLSLYGDMPAEAGIYVRTLKVADVQNVIEAGCQIANSISVNKKSYFILRQHFDAIEYANRAINKYMTENRETIIRQWKDVDFIDVYDFLKNEYKIDEYLIELPMLSDDIHHEIFRKIFLETNLISRETLNQIRDEIQKIKKNSK